MGFSSASLFPTRKWEAVIKVEIIGMNYLTRRIAQVAVIVKAWEDKRDREGIPDTFT